VQGPRCARGTCKKACWQRWKGRKDGIELNGRWYCGKQCLEQELLEVLERLPSGTPRPAGSAHRLPLGLLLLSRGAIDAEDLRRALAKKSASPEKKIGECLAEMGVVDELQVTRALGAQNCLPVLLARDIQRDGSVPARLQREYESICFRGRESQACMYIGFGGRVDPSYTAAVEYMTGLRAEPCMVAASVVRGDLGGMPKRRAPSEFWFEGCTSGSEVVRSIVSYARQCEARSVRVVSAGEFLWARAAGRSEPLHLLFRWGRC
jgi:hypothetical protein